MMSALHIAAREYAKRGVPVLACGVAVKTPATAHGVKDATCDLAVIDALWGREEYNIGIALEGTGLCALDMDGPDAEDAWFTLQVEHGFAADTYEVKTPRGRHLYFKGSLPPTISKLGARIDTRGRGSYVLAPPSVVGGKSYVASNDLEPIELPAWIAGLLTKPEHKSAKAPIASGKPVTAALVENMLRCISPAGDRNAWLIVCGGLVSAPVTDPAWDGLDLFVRWSRGDLHGGVVPANYQGPDDCTAQWERDVEKLHDVETIPAFGALVNLARECGYDGPSDSVPAAETFAPYLATLAHEEPLSDGAPREHAGKSVLPSYMGGEIGKITPPRWLIKGFLPTPAVGIYFGRFGTFKTTTELDTADSILNATKAFGHFDAEHGAVVLVAGEGLSGLKTRIEARAQNQGLTLDQYPLLLVTKVPKADRPEDWVALAETIRARGLKPKFIGIDHLSIMLSGQDQNDAAVATQAMQMAHELSVLFQCTVVILAHAGKDGDREVRGSSAFLDNVDFAYELTRTDGGDIVKVRCAKMRDGEAPEPFYLKAHSRHGAAIMAYADKDDARRASGKQVGLRVAEVSAVLKIMGACPGGVNEWTGQAGGISTKLLATEIARNRHEAAGDALEASEQEIGALVTNLNREGAPRGDFDVLVVAQGKRRMWAIAPGSIAREGGHV